jgi:hypothetical protein
MRLSAPSTWPKPNKDTGGEFIFVEASILTNRVFRHVANLQCAYF